MNVAKYLEIKAQETPSEVAMKIPRSKRRQGQIDYKDVSFEELNTFTNQIAQSLRANGLKRGERVLLMLKPGTELIAVSFALFKMGCVPILIDPGMGKKNLLICIERSQPVALIGIPLVHVISLIYRSAFSSVRLRVTSGRRWLWGGITLEQAKKESGDFRVEKSEEDELAAILFTSGSTGPPKGVCYPHGVFSGQLELLKNHFKIKPGEVDLPMLPIFALFAPALGMTTVIPEINPSRPASVDPQKITQAILQCRVSNSFGSPVLWTKIGEYCLNENIVLSSLRRILMAGAPVSPSLIERYRKIAPHAKIYTPYGATECLPLCGIEGEEILSETRAKTEAGAGMCVGSPLGEIEAKIIPIVKGSLGELSEIKTLNAGEKGEIIVRGQVVTSSYDMLEVATREAKIPDGETFWHRMGDVGYLDEKNRLWFCGRVTHRVTTPKGSMYSVCCEAIFNTLDGVRRTALIGLGEANQQRPALVVEWKEGDRPTTAKAKKEALAKLKERALSSEVSFDIKDFYYHPSFPVDVRHNAKIHRGTLAEWARGRVAEGEV